MGDNFQDMRNQFVVYWKKSGTDEYGEATVDSPVELKVLAEKNTVESRTASSDSVLYDYLINTSQDLVTGSIIWFGEKNDLPAQPTPLFQVVDTENYTDDEGKLFDRWSRLRRYGDTLPALT